jgi:hypothetical protein
VLGHELIGHMSFNDDEKYKALMNEVSYSWIWWIKQVNASVFHFYCIF